MTTRWLGPVYHRSLPLLGGLIISCTGWLGFLAPGLAQGPSVTYTLLQPGDRGAQVSQLQRDLAELGLDPGAVDGVYGVDTTEAVRSLQQQQGLVADGIVGEQTWQALLAAQRPVLALPPPALGADTIVFTPLTVAQPAPPPSALWLALMPLVPIMGGTLTYLHRRLQRWQRLRRHQAQRRVPPKPRLPR